jgi:uncharacterized protein
VAAIAALLLVAPSSEAQVNKKQSAQATKLTAATKTSRRFNAPPFFIVASVAARQLASIELAQRAATARVLTVSVT